MATEFLLGIPTMEVATADATKIAYRGGSNYVTTVNETSKEDYLAYLILLEKHGFEKIAENSEGWGGTVFSATFKRGEIVLTVVYYALSRKTNISFYAGPVSDRLVYKDSYVADHIAGAKTKMHMLELWWFGNSFVFQLKNGHFIISDGGYRNDLAYLLDYLESLAPEGEKPIVDAWIITHAHGDHDGALMTIVEMHQEWLDRIYVEGVYVSEPNDDVLRKCGGLTPHAILKMAANLFRTSNGEQTKLYRPQTGQRYYFSDITMDILYSQEQIEVEDYTNLNEASTVCLFTIEGQKCFLSGDVHENGLEFLVENYTREFLDLDFFTLNHHGYNTSQEFVEYATIRTALITNTGQLPAQRIRETKYLMSRAQEAPNWNDGTMIFTFPYTPGSYVRLPKNEWKYDEGVEKLPTTGHTYSLWGNNYTGFVFDADAVLFDGENLKTDVIKFLEFLQEKKVHMSVYSAKNTSELETCLEQSGINEYFELILGYDKLDKENIHTDALAQSEIAFQTNHHKLVVLCNSLEAVETIVMEGVKTAVITDGKEVSEEIERKSWKRFAVLDEFIEYLVSRDVIYE